MHNLKAMDLPLESLCLDPNNPRFIDEDVVRHVPESSVHEEQVQQRALTRLCQDRYEINQLRESIENIGFLPVDRLVVIQITNSDKYMVIEGNRRLAALKLVRQAYDNHEVDLSSETVHSIGSIPVLLIDDTNTSERDHFARVLQGVRHLSSVKQWGPYQQAQLIATMIRDDKKLSEIKSVLGLSAHRINSLRRVYFALEEMSKDPDYGEYAKPDLFSLFEEALKIPAVRTWLGWDDEKNSCADVEHRQLFYSWCVGIEEDGTRYPRKITDAKDLRRLPALREDPTQFKRFISDPRLTLADAAQGAVTSEPEIDWRGVLQTSINTLGKVPALALRHATDADVAVLENIKQQCDDLLDIIQNTHHVEHRDD